MSIQSSSECVLLCVMSNWPSFQLVLCVLMGLMIESAYTELLITQASGKISSMLYFVPEFQIIHIRNLE